MSQQSILDKSLREAIEMQDLPAAESLLNQGANPNATNHMWYMSPLQTAACRDNVELVQLLLDRGARINTQGGYYGSALLGAAHYGKLEIVELLIAAGADVDIHGTYGTALAVAKDKGFEDVVQVLKSLGATEWRPGPRDADDTWGSWL
ncbi:hypothetical protein ASPVEDRAFT_42653 [Aspergillus versicolor CBS 583.65]|uniref:Uncharacterized protein n=1 Tax=Aspergillus versicolor CBS 583.65 TaxID=1036611 RepID=A0A1L9PNP3_ASPVE|nr:uncharacterized protein ASPVEDRAFT_42653 [Aspergillus versicolor CBS 583.65]OJJ03140.1 hypothetical protein ASPVEDRAFT_42653 [Aspergillus versicolor CBS 583.65]